MSVLKARLAEQIPGLRRDVQELVAEHGDAVISQVSVAQAFGGMRGVRGLVCDTSLVEPDTGLSIRGWSVGELAHVTAEECFHLLLTGDRPEPSEIEDLRADWKRRGEVPGYVFDLFDALPDDTHPMTMFSSAVLAMQRESKFAAAYIEGITRDEHWETTFEDACDLLAKLPAIAAAIYRKQYDKGPRLESEQDLDWGADFAHLLGIDDPSGEFATFLRMFMVLHSDHEGGNVSAHASTVVGSALSDLYYALSAGLNGLAGPLHGLANQQCLRFVLALLEARGDNPTDEDVRAFCLDRLAQGRVIPGYGHAVLRCPDPRFTAFFEFGSKRCADSPVFRVVTQLQRLVPEILQEQGKAKNPWPNVDAGSGSLLYHYGLTEVQFYTVLFGVSRAMGITAQQVLARALGMPLERPKSVGTQWIRDQVAGATS